jgi:hypothetical protein
VCYRGSSQPTEIAHVRAGAIDMTWRDELMS